MTQEQVYEEVLKGLKNKKSIIRTLKRLNYASSTFYKPIILQWETHQFL